MLISDVQTSRSLQSRRQALVELTSDVRGLGQICEYHTNVLVVCLTMVVDDRMAINPGRARNELVPNGSARMIPWKRRAERIKHLASTRSTIVYGQGSTVGSTSNSSAPIDGTTPTPRTLLESLYGLPPAIILHRRTTSPSTDVIHGSVGLHDVLQHLRDDHGLENHGIEATWADPKATDHRLRQLGHYDCWIRVQGHGQESAPLSVEVRRLDE